MAPLSSRHAWGAISSPSTTASTIGRARTPVISRVRNLTKVPNFTVRWTSQGCEARGSPIVFGDSEHAVGPLPVPREPANQLPRAPLRMEDVIVLDGDPLTAELSQPLAEARSLSRDPGARFTRGRRRGVAPPRAEAEPHQRSPGLVGREIGPIETRHRADDLLGRKAPIPDHDEVALDRFRIEMTYGPSDIPVAQDQPAPVAGDPASARPPGPSYGQSSCSASSRGPRPIRPLRCTSRYSQDTLPDLVKPIEPGPAPAFQQSVELIGGRIQDQSRHGPKLTRQIAEGRSLGL